jgi:nucleoside-diphosphate-sugar epimerase
LTEDQLHNGPPHDSNFGYAYAKRMVDVQLKAANQQYGHEYISVIPNNMYGEHDNFDLENGHVIPALIRKIWEAKINNKSAFEVWGDGEQTRSFLYIDECIEATRRLMESDFLGPVNIGSEEMVTINRLVETVAKVAGKTINIEHIDGPLGVRGRNSNNDLIREKLQWDYSTTLEEGIAQTYAWISEQIAVKK